jgi:hypothetical protein
VGDAEIQRTARASPTGTALAGAHHAPATGIICPLGVFFSQGLDNKSRLIREGQGRFRESAGVRFPRATRPSGRVKGEWKYLYRAVDKEGHTIDFLLTPTRDRDAAEAFLHKAIRNQGLPEKITIDQSGSNTAAIKHYNKTLKTAIGIRHSKYLNNMVEQDHRAVKRLVRPMLDFKSFWAARCTIAGIEVMHAIRKGQLVTTGEEYQTPADQFYSLAGVPGVTDTVAELSEEPKLAFCRFLVSHAAGASA